MKIESIDSSTFGGKVKFDKKLTKPMVEYANKILDAPFSGTTARERIARATYDVKISGRATKRTIHPKLSFTSEFKCLKDPKKYSVCLSHIYSTSGSSIHSTVAEGAYKLNEHLTNFERHKNWYNYSYNTFGEKVSAFFRRMFGIRK